MASPLPLIGNPRRPAGTLLGLALGILLMGCTGAGAPTPSATELRAQIAPLDLQSLSPPDPGAEALRALGAALYFDPILSGNRDISCATCHHPEHGLGDGRSLAVGTNAVLTEDRRLPGPDHSFTPRNAPPLFNLGQPGLHTMFWDRRLEESDTGGFILHDTSYEATGVIRLALPDTLEGLMAAQAALPLLIRDEMRGDAGEVDIDGHPNELALITDDDFDGVWRLVMERLLSNEAYRTLFTDAFPETPLENLDITAFANALASFIVHEFTLLESSWDRFLDGDDAALDDAARRGASLFFGEAQCATCHAGDLFTDQNVRNIGVRPMSRGPTVNGSVDLGAAHRSNAGPEAVFAFRTPPLRNVAATGPWLHNGSAVDLETAIRQHLDPEASLYGFDPAVLEPEFRNQVHRDDSVLRRVMDTLDPEVRESAPLSGSQIADLIAFLEALSSPYLETLPDLIPAEVPSGLELVDP